MTNHGNQYKFRALNKMRSNPTMVSIQGMKKNGKWGVPFETEMLGCEKTAEDVVNRLEKLNHRKYQIVEEETNYDRYEELRNTGMDHSHAVQVLKAEEDS